MRHYWPLACLMPRMWPTSSNRPTTMGLGSCSARQLPPHRPIPRGPARRSLTLPPTPIPCCRYSMRQHPSCQRLPQHIRKVMTPCRRRPMSPIAPWIPQMMTVMMVLLMLLLPTSSQTELKHLHILPAAGAKPLQAASIEHAHTKASHKDDYISGKPQRPERKKEASMPARASPPPFSLSPSLSLPFCQILPAVKRIAGPAGPISAAAAAAKAAADLVAVFRAPGEGVYAGGDPSRW
ncbi:hypothetical protein H696_05141 [Fonticula alba]|uniref:Uncharacterized protein n=1 Tax=Fonticula alba TaxID=691883 RepID=A0A058Z1S2_FONAL|nr:hypothetical protein H696_05141 [Fonticula alba]KCV68215.1 hypothetical protein H696_05141 [Fonticula alba]|eukprot:XP_009497269.1 hypothetical protein H696_05141 [Fonticula alba]